MELTLTKSVLLRNPLGLSDVTLTCQPSAGASPAVACVNGLPALAGASPTGQIWPYWPCISPGPDTLIWAPVV
jgi:hypothetical protein